MNSWTRENYKLYIDRNTGTKRREFFDGAPRRAEYPDSIDLKITNHCDLAHICQYCHESSTREGEHADPKYLSRLISVLKGGTEIAIGGGDPLSYPILGDILGDIFYNMSPLYPSITVNQLHLKRYFNKLDEFTDTGLIYGLGVSYRQDKFDGKTFDLIKDYPHTVWHFILGVHTVEDVKKVLDWDPSAKILLLGYKNIGRGASFFDREVEENIQQWGWQIREFLDEAGVVSFDTLALQQLNLKRFFSSQLWQQLFMGEEGQFSMYIDAVNQTAAKSSFSEEQVPFKENELSTNNLKQVFKQIKRL